MNRTIKRFRLVTLLAALCVIYAQAQQVARVRLNEILVINEDNFVDDYGSRSGWIELYNNSAGTVNIAGCYLVKDDIRYAIPKGDVLTKIPPRQHILFWADGKPERGTFHVNFTLDPDKANHIALYDTDGKTLVDEVTVPAGQQPDESYGVSIEGARDWQTLKTVTPSSNNKILDSNEKIKNFQDNDSLGVGMTITAMSVVFMGLFLLYIAFKSVGKGAIKASQRRRAKAAANGTNGHHHEPESGEIFAAIAAALYETMEEDVHDLENTVLTIRKVARSYSPWSSKIYGLREPLTK
ncbi:MAG: lamin tail domain-containing protein [Tannerella sp.]|jgi:Na+-transporting methylmalonyl-CoA/oxaloacetate decarboxylase gamma subunit|nr:lamin tail domain-containing protein [Tannerella sp.]